MSLVTFPSLNPKSLPFSEVLIMNGPGTCVILCMAVYINKVCVPPSLWCGHIELMSLDSFLGVRLPSSSMLNPLHA